MLSTPYSALICEYRHQSYHHQREPHQDLVLELIVGLGVQSIEDRDREMAHAPIDLRSEGPRCQDDILKEFGHRKHSICAITAHHIDGAFLPKRIDAILLLDLINDFIRHIVPRGCGDTIVSGQTSHQIRM